MTTALYRYRPQPTDDKKSTKLFSSITGEVTTFTDADPSRPELTALLAGVEDGSFDRVVVARLGELGMSARRLASLLEDCRVRDVRVVSAHENFDLMTVEGAKLAAFLAGVTRDERVAQSERQGEGIAHAKATGRTWGGRPAGTRIKVSPEVERSIAEQFAAGTPVKDIAAQVRVSVRTVYRYLDQVAEGRS